MSTNTNTTATTKVIVKAASEVSKAFSTFSDLAAKVDNSFVAVGIAGLMVAKRQDYTERQQVSDMFRLSIYQQADVAEKHDNESDADFQARQLVVADAQKSNISMWTTFVMCKDEPARLERDKAIAYNDALPKGHKPNVRIGQKLMLDICKGQVSADDTIAIKEGRAPAAGSTARASGQVAKTTPATATDAKPVGETATDANSPEGQAATVPVPSATDKPIGNPKDAMRANLKTAVTAFENNLGLSRSDIAAILREVADSLS